ncbi:MAG: hypothetical protein WCP09_00790 [Candidatus Taylorbacteria bacterium]
MKNHEKYYLLCRKLSSFGIRSLTNWAARKEREWLQDMVPIRKEMIEIPGDETSRAFHAQTDKHIQTVGCLIRNYPYRFVHARTHTNYGVNGLGKEPIEEFKKMLLKLGLTPDDWPALVPHDELLVHLSKPAILNLPAKEIFPTLDKRECRGFTRCLGWTDEGAETKTVRDLIQFDPLNIAEEAPNISPRRFFESRKRFFIALRQDLVKKGFSSKDGKFFNWNPIAPAVKKAQRVLRKHSLTPSELLKFAQIAVAERWVI